jgi:hypothetical protein
LRLDIAMDDLRILGMEIVERVAELIGPTDNLIFRKRTVSFGEHRGQIFASDVLHDQELSFGFVEVIADSRQGLMMKPRQQASFTFELLAQLFVGEERFFEGYDGVKAFVDGLVNRTHSALPKLADNAVSFL